MKLLTVFVRILAEKPQKIGDLREGEEDHCGKLTDLWQIDEKIVSANRGEKGDCRKEKGERSLGKDKEE